MDRDLLRCLREVEAEIASEDPAQRSNAMRRIAIHLFRVEQAQTENAEELRRVRTAVLGTANTDPDIQEGGLLGAHRRQEVQMRMLRWLVRAMLVVVATIGGAVTWGLTTLQHVAGIQQTMIEHVARQQPVPDIKDMRGRSIQR